MLLLTQNYNYFYFERDKNEAVWDNYPFERLYEAPKSFILTCDEEQ